MDDDPKDNVGLHHAFLRSLGVNLSVFEPPSSPPRKYAIFISHAWKHDYEYQALADLIKPDLDFNWENLSVTKSDPLELHEILSKSHRFLIRQLDCQIKKAECLLVLAGMYVAHSPWIQSEIEAAIEFNVPIIGIAPRGNERYPEAVMHAAVGRAGWNRRSVIDAIRQWARPAIAPMTARPPYKGF